MGKNAYITYISNGRDYKAVLNLAYNLRKINSKFPLHCICLEDVPKSIINILESRGIIIFNFNLTSKLIEFNLNQKEIQMYMKIYIDFLLTILKI